MTASRALRPSFAVAAALALVACAGNGAPTPAPDATATASDATAPGVRIEATVAADTGSFARTLIELDRRVDRYVYLMSQAGADARGERELLGPALRATVAQHEKSLLAAAADPSDPTRRRVAVKSLAFSDDPEAVRVLVEALRESRDSTLLTAATYALGRIASASTAPEPLLDLVQHPDVDVRSNALMALWKVFSARQAVGASPLDPVAQDAALPKLEVALFDPADPIVRGHAAATLGSMGDRRAVDSLLNLLRDEHPFVRTQTALALGKLGDPRAIPALVQLIDETPHGTPKSAVLAALAALVEATGRTVPESLGDSERAWEQFVR